MTLKKRPERSSSFLSVGSMWKEGSRKRTETLGKADKDELLRRFVSSSSITAVTTLEENSRLSLCEETSCRVELNRIRFGRSVLAGSKDSSAVSPVPIRKSKTETYGEWCSGSRTSSGRVGSQINEEVKLSVRKQHPSVGQHILVAQWLHINHLWASTGALNNPINHYSNYCCCCYCC